MLCSFLAASQSNNKKVIHDYDLKPVTYNCFGFLLCVCRMTSAVTTESDTSKSHATRSSDYAWLIGYPREYLASARLPSRRVGCVILSIAG